MRYRITNVTNAYLTLEPPSLFKRGESTYREYSVIPDRILYLKEKGLIELVPVGPPETGPTFKNSSNIEQTTIVESKQRVEPILPSVELNKNLQFKSFNISYDIEFVNITEVKKGVL